MSAAEDAAAAHAHLAGFFAGMLGTPQPNRFTPDRSTMAMPNRRKLSELPYQQTVAGLWPAVTDTLTDLSFVQAKCSAGATGDLVADYDRAMAAMHAADEPPADEQTTALAEFRRFVQRERSTFETFSGIDGVIFQQARNQGRSAAVSRAWTRLETEAAWRGPRWFGIDRPHDAADPLLATLLRHRRGVTDCAFDASGSVLVSSGMDGAVFLWRTSDWGFLEVIAELGASADSCSMSGDGTRVATACADGYIRIHNRLTRTTMVCDGKYEAHPRRCRFARGDELLVSVGGFGLKVHETATGRVVRDGLAKSTLNDCAIGPRVLAGAGAEVVAFCESPDGATLIGACADG